MTDTSPIYDVIKKFESAWNRLDMNGLEQLWHEDEAEIYYLAEEMDEPYHKFSDVKAYWKMTASVVEQVKVILEDVRCRLLADTIATVTFRMHVDASMTGFKAQGFKPIGSDVKVTVILRHTQKGWRFVHYMEAHLGALPFIRRVYNQNVRSSFE